MTESSESEIQELYAAIGVLESRRQLLGDAAADNAIAALREKILALDTQVAKPEPTSSRVTLELLNQEIPAALAQKILTARGHVEGERKIVTILFSDIVGSTALAERLDPEDWRVIVANAHKLVSTAVYAHEGTIAQLLGDGVLAFFGAPVTHEDDPLRAVRTALEIQERCREYARTLDSRLGNFQLRIGINTGMVVVDNIGTDLHFEYLAIGDAVNLAARLQSAAQPGTILISQHTYYRVAGFFETEGLGEIRVKGKAEPISVMRVTGLKAKPGKRRGFHGKGIDSPIVGRSTERALLKASVDRLCAGQGGILSVIADAGLGKSRLLGEVQQSFTFDILPNPSEKKTQIPQWLEGQTLSFGQTISYWPFQEILRNWSGITEEDNESQAWVKFEGRVLSVFGEETIEYLPFLASLLALELQGQYLDRVKYLDGAAMGKQIFLTSRRFFERLASLQPTVLVFEDLHWMDASSANLLEHLLPLVNTVPLLFVGLSRPERGTPAERLRQLCARNFAERYTEVLLTPLATDESAQLVQNLLQDQEILPSLREQILSKAEGNPFYLEEVIRALIDMGAITRDPTSERWKAGPNMDMVKIPGTIQGLIMARVDCLSDELKQVLRVAAVIGRSFLYRVLRAVVEDDAQLDVHLAALQHVEFIREEQAAPELEFMFKHALTQEVTYESILLQKRRELHAHVGHDIELLFGDRLEEFYGLLAYHYARGEMWEKAQEYLLKAGDQAGGVAADDEALNYYEQAMAVYGLAFQDKWHPLERASFERKMGESFMRRSQYVEAIEHFRLALSALGYQLPMTRWQVRTALVRELLLQVGHRFVPKLFLKSAAGSSTPEVESEALVYFHTALIDAFTNSERYLLLALKLLNLSEPRGYSLGMVLGAGNLAVTLDFLSFFGLAGWYHRKAASVAETSQHPYAIGSAYFGLEAHTTYLGSLDQSLEYGNRSANAYRRAGDFFNWGLSTSYLAWLSFLRANYAEAHDLCAQLIRIGQDAGLRALCCWGESIQGFAWRRQGLLAEALTHQRQAMKLADEIQDHIYQVIAHAEVGLCSLWSKEIDTARSELKKSHQLVIEHRVLEPFSLVNLSVNQAEAALWVAEHSDTGARPSLMDQARAACRAALKDSSKCKFKASEAMRLQGTYDWLRGKPDTASQWWRKATLEAQRIRLPFEEGMICLEMARRLGEAAQLERAEAIFSKIGAERQLGTTEVIESK